MLSIFSTLAKIFGVRSAYNFNDINKLAVKTLQKVFVGIAFSEYDEIAG